MSIIKALSAPQQRREVIQIIDGVQYRTIRAKLVADNGQGQALYYDARPERVADPIDHARSADVQPELCYFLVNAKAMGPTMLFGIEPISDKAAAQWAKTNGVALTKGVASKPSAAAVQKQLIAPRRSIAQVVNGVAYSTSRATLIHDTSGGKGQSTPDTEALFYDPAPEAMLDHIKAPGPTYFLLKQAMNGGLPLLVIQPITPADAAEWAKKHGVSNKLTVGKATPAAALTKVARQSVQKVSNSIDAMKVLMQHRPNEVAELLVRRFVR